MNGQTPFAPGLHILLDLFGGGACADEATLEPVLRAAARAAGAQVLSCHFHGFGGAGGVTGVLLLAESHISVHTWPEQDYAAVDIFMCGNAEAGKAADHIARALQPQRIARQDIPRGQGNQVDQPSR